MKKALYPGSFDPITYGHMDVIEQALKVYDIVVIGVFVNSQKKPGMFDMNERAKMISEIYKDNGKVEVVTVDGNIASVDVAEKNGCETMIRGLRDLTDFAEELKLAELNRSISDGKINTVAFFANPGKTTISSTAVKELSRLGKSIKSFVHPIVEKNMAIKMRREK